MRCASPWLSFYIIQNYTSLYKHTNIIYTTEIQVQVMAEVKDLGYSVSGVIMALGEIWQPEAPTLQGSNTYHWNYGNC